MVTYPSDYFGGVPAQYATGGQFVPDQSYQGGGYYAYYNKGTQFTYPQLERLWLNAGGSPSLDGVMAKIAEDESGGYNGDWNSSGATGLWQIEYPSSAPAGMTRQELFNPANNAKAAVRLSGNTMSGVLSNWAGDSLAGVQNVPPAASVPKVSAGGKVTSGKGGSGTGSNAQLTSFNPLSPSSWFGSFASGITSAFGASSFKDLMQRFGLIILGAVILLMGLTMMVGKQAEDVVTLVNGGNVNAGGSEGKSEGSSGGTMKPSGLIKDAEKVAEA